MSHSPAVNVLGAVLHEKRDNENNKALRVFGGEKRKRKKGVIKTKVEGKGRKQVEKED